MPTKKTRISAPDLGRRRDPRGSKPLIHHEGEVPEFIGAVITPGRLAFALALAAAAGALFDWASLPLPWILGPLIATAAAAVLGLPVSAPTPVRPYVVAVIGVMLGSGFSPEFLDQIADWSISFVFLALYIVTCGLVVVPYYRRVAGFDETTAYFSGMPGGLSEMMIAGREAGGDDRLIVLAHVSRIIIVVALIAFWFRVVIGVDLAERPDFGTPTLSIPPIELALMMAAGTAGYLSGRALRLPAPNLLGPLLASAAIHLAGWTSSPPPLELAIAAQILLGTIMGGRFIGVPARRVGRAIAVGLGATVIMLCTTFALAFTVYKIVGQPLDQVVLAYSPGGLAEMSIVAVAMGADLVFVSCHHVTRIALVMALAPLAFKFFAGRRE